MSLHNLADSCIRLAEYSGPLQIAFGLNLALPILRELAVLQRGPLQRQISAVESLVRFRQFANSDSQTAATAKIESIKRRLILGDDELSNWVTACAAVTFMFALSSLYWLFYAAGDFSCLGSGLSRFVSIVHFLPLPICISVLQYRGKKIYDNLRASVEEVKADVLGGL